MQNKTVYTYDLLLKLNLTLTAGPRKLFLVIGLLSAAFSAWNLADAIKERSLTDACFAVLGVSLCLLLLVYGIIWSKWHIEKMVRKAVALDPDPTVSFDFGETLIYTERVSRDAHLFSETAYTVIESIGLLDGKSCYVKLKTNSYLILREEEGILPLCRFLVDKTGATPNGTTKTGPRLWTVQQAKNLEGRR